MPPKFKRAVCRRWHCRRHRGDDADAVARATSEVYALPTPDQVKLHCHQRGARKKFWQDRKRTAAIPAIPTRSRSTKTW